MRKNNFPPAKYVDENVNYYKWDEFESKFIPSVLETSYNSVGQLTDNTNLNRKTQEKSVAKPIKYIENKISERCLFVQQQNNLLYKIGMTYGEKNKEFVKKLYKLGTNKDGGIIFWSINKQHKVQNAKIVYYNKEGKRKQKFKVPYKNEDCYYNCLVGEHFLGLHEYKNNPIILVESK